MIVCGITVDKKLSFRQEIDKIPIFNFFDRPTDGPTDRQTDRQKDRPTDRQTDRQTDRHSEV